MKTKPKLSLEINVAKKKN